MYFRIYGSTLYAVPNCAQLSILALKKILKYSALGPHVILMSHNSVVAWARMGISHLNH